MHGSIQSLGYGLLSMLLVIAVATLCTVVNTTLKKYLRQINRKAHAHEQD
jgi:hypothetical protein